MITNREQEAPSGQGLLEYVVLIGLILFILASVYLLLAPEMQDLNQPARSRSEARGKVPGEADPVS